ncbi:siderophore ABC transporter ATP-binding protein [Vibrio albus]|uniref:Siderophore ABC transporter ATP-binding protein n=1 Tax=Vibrio albus TaxID=2200953 RepID=A0A2U3BD65_9VIBR|nr:ATP-binding cassette domain-containing protein [Vibrio albus]PWI34749.1 siderophore ABC transporter ATP-binding protein [Vibrio albus]
MIEIHKLHKKYGDQVVVDQVSASFSKGKVTSIIGPNGAGKSTLLSIASRLLSADNGHVVIEGKAINDWNTTELAKTLSVLRQSNNVTMRFTVREMVAFGRFPYSHGRLTKFDQKVIDQAIDYLDLRDIQSCYMDELSGGQRQLAYIAMVIAQDTDYIYLDEPLNNLDIKHSLQIMRVLREMSRELNKAVILVIHDINFASCYSDTLIALKKGKLKAQGSVYEVIRSDVLTSIYETPFIINEVNGKRICMYY